MVVTEISPLKRDKAKIIHNLNVRMPNLVMGFTTDPLNQLLSPEYQKAAWRVNQLRTEKSERYYSRVNKIFEEVWALGNDADEYHKEKKSRHSR